MVFIVIAGFMLCIAAACMVVPLWRGHAASRPSYETAYRSAHANQMAELERDLAAGRLATSDHAAALRDLDRELTASLGDKTEARPSGAVAPRSRIMAVATGLVLVISMAVGYWQLGNWRVAVEGIPAATAHHMDAMVAQLSRQLHTTDQSDLQGWIMLGHAYVLMDRYNEAVEALDRARKLSGDSDPDLLASYAEALALANPDQFMQKAAPLFEKVLQEDPNNVRALWYGGLAAIHRGDKKLAVQRWRLLLAQNLPPQYQAVVKEAIEDGGGVDTTTAPPQVEVTTINIQVTLDSKLRNQVSPEESVFVYAEPAGSHDGPPLAVRRFQVRELPLSMTLSDKDAMVPGRNISNYAHIALTARISRTGSPIPQNGDFEGKTIWNRSDGGKIMTIEIKS